MPEYSPVNSTRYSNVVDALRVFLTDPRIRDWLDDRDPKAVEQAIRALGYDPGRKVLKEE
jgi:hypothetical protein